MPSSSEIQIGYQVSRWLRWLLGATFLFIAWWYHDGTYALYFFGALLIISGFFKPQRCVAGNCSSISKDIVENKKSNQHVGNY